MKYQPKTVMLNWLDPTFGTESKAVHVTVVVPTRYLPPDTTTLPAWSSHIMLAAEMGPSTTSVADGNCDQSTAASGIPGSTFIEGTLSGAVTTGPSLSA